MSNKSGEFKESYVSPLAKYANLEPSRVYTRGRCRDYRVRVESRGIPARAPDAYVFAKKYGEEIVQSCGKLQCKGSFFKQTAIMNWDYITGFFDADGSITLSKHHNAPYKTVQVYFHNNELALLEEIRDFIEKETGIKGVILTKKPAKIEHRTAYDLRYIYFRTANRILKNMPSKHPKKRHRISISFELEKLTPRNGKYTEVTLARRLEKEKEFFAH